MIILHICPLCAHASRFYAEDFQRAFSQCSECGLVFADPSSHPDAAAEKAVYDLHQNDPGDDRYRAFLARLAKPLIKRLQPGMEGLDYGCGPGPALAQMLSDAGMRMALYDPFYAPETAVLARTYDFVTCTETVEHFRRPAENWDRLAALLRPGAWLGVMTQLVISRERFCGWQYKNDQTHLCFYSLTVFQWLADRYCLELQQVDRDVLLLRKPGRPI
ncbi:class I SAM-dependent methyltransferase [Candidatus Methylospira mobilis]|uniref:class I SAM-dependent methyltransferase n=1 Tax=Candidatus Methylospira mobilis TaxID=1808979 RepID=UPI001D176864|nr:class I SAM-dependent methyltransferase [Candidatus Methylospira mobilis]WNV05782.1 class I SAM-dependent methyltransferase [Candidatus Methylospira mobilis]